MCGTAIACKHYQRGDIFASGRKIGGYGLRGKRIVTRATPGGKSRPGGWIEYTETYLISGLNECAQHHVSTCGIGRIYKNRHSREQQSATCRGSLAGIAATVVFHSFFDIVVGHYCEFL